MYIFQDQTTRWYKFGISGDIETRRKKLCYDHYGRSSQDKITEYYSWSFQNYFAALLVEQSAISILKKFGFEEVRPSDWFDLNKQTIDVLMEMVGDLARCITKWEMVDGSMKCDALRRDQPYGAYLRREKIGEQELRFRYIDILKRAIREGRRIT